MEESYIGKEGKRIEYARTTRTNHSEPVNKIETKLYEAGDKYLKHRIYVDNCDGVFPLIKETYSAKFVELDFSQNISLRPKDEVQSAHFSGRQFTLHGAILDASEMYYYYHLSDDILRARCGIKNEDFWIQSDNASNQCKINIHSDCFNN